MDVTDINPAAVLVATVVAFALSGAYYTIVAGALAAVSDAPRDDRMPPSKIAAELGRTLVLAIVVTCLARSMDADGLRDGLALGAGLWIGFPVVLWTGAVLHESTPRPMAAIHAGDWLPKLLVIASIAGLWP